MATWPSDSVRTKDWGTEILTDSDLETQLDLLHSYIQDMMNSSTGHKHDGTSNEGPKIALNGANIGVSGELQETLGGTGMASYTQGDILYASASDTLSVLAVGTKGQTLTTGGAAANPSWEGMTTQGDIEYHDGTNRARLAAGTAEYFLKTGGAGANPSWAKAIKDIKDYGTSASSSTSKNTTDLYICYGTVALISGSITISNLPFSSTSSYTVIASRDNSGSASQAIVVNKTAGSSFTMQDSLGGTDNVNWIAIGT